MIHDHGYWLDNSNDGHVFDQSLATALLTVFAGRTVVDIGCGKGDYVKVFRGKGIVCDGYDGNPLTPTFDPLLKVCDFSKLTDIGLYDWVLSLEVGEHIPKEYEQAYIENVHKSNRLGIVLSWAIEGQIGRGHVNCRNNDYIKDIFKGLGYENDLDSENRLRSLATLPWLPKTLMVFRK
jgi:cyclopropane fatty-acyl-phospholipid synthase-like methyltransferase